MLLPINQPSRPAMIRTLLKYTSLSIEVLSTLNDSEVRDLTTRLKHEVVVSDGTMSMPQEICLG